MTLEECRSATANLAFAHDLADIDDTAEDGFLYALRRALYLTEGACPRTVGVELEHFPEEGEGPYVCYDLPAMFSHVREIVAPPEVITEEGYYPLRRGYRIESRRRLYLSVCHRGRFYIKCRPAVAAIDADSPPDTPLGLDEEVAQLLPLLVAHYLLLDEDPEKAAHYMTLYREQYGLLGSRRHEAAPTEYHTVNNW